MFDFSFWEFAIVLVVALLVIGPDKLPIVAAKAGRWVGKAKRMISSVRSDIEDELKAAELKEMLEKQQGEISQLRDILNDTQNEILHESKEIMEDVSSATNLSKDSNESSSTSKPS
ncbi:MAG: Sec-independent protein translocase protein TatB [Pseudomonadota bacterium]